MLCQSVLRRGRRLVCRTAETISSGGSSTRPDSHRITVTGHGALTSQRNATTSAAGVHRGDYATLNDEDVSQFEAMLGRQAVITDADTLAKYNTDWMNMYKGNAVCVLRPTSTAEVAAVLRRCYARRLAVCTQAGNTGLVGASVPVFDELILSTDRLKRTYDFDPLSGILTCSAGWILEELDTKLAEDGYQMPLDLGAKGSCQIGGNLATSAGGLRLIRYGSLHAHLLAMTVVLADKPECTVLRVGKPLRKDNTGLHLPHLFVGSEGQLGVITRASLTAVPRPTSVHVAILACHSFADCCRVLLTARRSLGEILSSFELMDRPALRCVRENRGMENALDADEPFFLLVEAAGSDEEHDKEKMDRFLATCFDDGSVVDGVVAASGEQRRRFWLLRETITDSLTHDGYVYKNDISLPQRHFYTLTEVVKERIGSLAKRVVTYGHLGDGNTHLNITSEHFDQELYDRLYPFMYDWTAEHGGSISAEHGVGLMKIPYFHLANNPETTEAMRQVKRLFDPRLILNPYKTIPM